METKSKFEIGQTLFTIEKMKIKSFIVERITVFSDKNGTNVYYKKESDFSSYKEEDCFLTEDELFKHLRS